MQVRLALGAVWIALCAADASAQVRAPLSADVDLSAFRIEDAAAILGGGVSVAYARGGPRLNVTELTDKVFRAPSRVEGSARPPLERGCFNLGIDRGGALNRLGGRFGAYGASSSADVGRLDDRRGGITFECDREAGFCGFWLHLFESDSPVTRTYVDASSLASISFWLRRGDAAGRLDVKVADARWVRREDAVRVGGVDEFVEQGADTAGWERVVVPLAALPDGLARDSLASLTIEVLDSARTRLGVTGLELCAESGRPSPLPPPAPKEAAVGQRAMWVWNTRELIQDAGARRSFLNFVERGDYDLIFLQLATRPGASPRDGFVPFDSERMGALVADLGALGAGVYALDGDPRYVLEENHQGVLRTVNAVVGHNRRRPEDERFIGVRYDIEPYLVPGWGERKAELLDDWVRLMSGISGIARAAGLQVGVDLPFWLDGYDRETGDRNVAELGGVRKPVLEHLFGVVDDVALMNYRTSAFGVDGSVSHAMVELDMAARYGTRIFLGMETEALVDEDLFRFEAAEPGRGVPPASDGGHWILLDRLGDEEARVWLTPASGVGSVVAAVRERGGDPARLLHWRTGTPVRVGADRLTFNALGEERMEEESANARTQLVDHPAFAGIAYHQYTTLKELAERRTGGR